MAIAHSAPRGRPDAEAVIERVSDPLARRVGDVLRAGNRARRAILIDDEENVLQAMRSGIRVEAIVLSRDVRALGPELAGAARAHGARIRRIDEAVTAALFGRGKRARVFALAACPRKHTLDDIAARPGDILVLDGVRLAGNIGALTRSAAALGAAGIVLIDSGMTSVYDRRLIRASRGLVFALPVVLAAPADLPGFLDRAGAGLVGLAATADVPLAELARMPGRVALLLGGERCGASRELEALAERRLAVPMSPGVESLNVSVAGALALYERRPREPATTT